MARLPIYLRNFISARDVANHRQHGFCARPAREPTPPATKPAYFGLPQGPLGPLLGSDGASGTGGGLPG